MHEEILTLHLRLHGHKVYVLREDVDVDPGSLFLAKTILVWRQPRINVSDVPNVFLSWRNLSSVFIRHSVHCTHLQSCCTLLLSVRLFFHSLLCVQCASTARSFLTTLVIPFHTNAGIDGMESLASRP